MHRQESEIISSVQQQDLCEAAWELGGYHQLYTYDNYKCTCHRGVRVHYVYMHVKLELHCVKLWVVGCRRRVM